MEILSIKKASGLDSEPYVTLLNKGIRSESLYHINAVHILIKPTKWIDCFYRLFWEANYLHLKYVDMSKFISFTDDKSWDVFEMHMTLAEAFDFLYDATPPLYRKGLPDSTKNIDDIIELMKTFLLEKSKQLETYHSIFEKITKYGWFEKPNVMDMRYLDVMREQTPTGPICQVLYSTTPLERYHDESHVTTYGIFVLGFNNNKDVKEFIDIMYKHSQKTIEVCDIHKDPSRGMFVMVQYTGSMLNSIITKSYEPFLS